MQNPYIILQARMNSERLPGKVMREVAGKPLIGILINRLKASGIPIVLATSTNPENDVLVNYVKGLGVKVFRGSEDNVLERYYLAAKAVNATTVFRLTGDNPYIDKDLILNVYSYYEKIKSERKYLSTALSSTFPIGYSIEIFSFKLLEEAFQNSDDLKQKEHVTPYFHQNIPGNIEIVAFPFKKDRHNYRLTVDTISDFELAKRIFEDFNGENLTSEEIIDLLDRNPFLVDINSAVNQKNWKE